MMQSYELVGQRVELWILPAYGSVVPSVELTDVQKGDNQEVECIETRFLDWKPTVAVASVSTFDLDPKKTWGLSPGFFNLNELLSRLDMPSDR